MDGHRHGCTVGVDEAGRGPAIGPMVVAAVAIPDDVSLPSGIDDSKAIASDRRAELAGRLRDDDHIEIGIETVRPAVIDHPQTDMNTLTVDAMARAIRGVARPDMAGILDAGDPDCERFATRVKRRLDADVPLRAFHKADETYPAVGAASIVAKVERDALIAELEEEYGSIGSGYPSDPATKRFLSEYVQEHGRLPACARASWKTCRDVVAASTQAEIDRFRSEHGSVEPR